MSPEERAQRVERDLGWHHSNPALRELVTAAIPDAVREEREACAKECDDIEYSASMRLDYDGLEWLQIAAENIRARRSL